MRERGKYGNDFHAFSECQNFTQLIWKSTQQVGAGRVWLQSKGVVAVVAFYFPRGNRNGFGEFQKNVLPPLTQ